MIFNRKKQPKREMPFETRKRRYGKVTSKYSKQYTQKEWKRFSPDIQQELTNRYNVTITDYKTRNEKIKEFGGKVSKGLATMEMSQPKGKSVNYLDTPINIKSPNTLGMFDNGFGKKKKKSNGYFDDLARF